MEHILFEATPGFSVAILPDDSLYYVVAASDDFVRLTGFNRKDMYGKDYLRFFQNGTNNQISSLQNLKNSFSEVVRSQDINHIPLQRYDILKADGTYTEQYWKIINVPVKDSSGKIEYIILSAEDHTRQVKSEDKKEGFPEKENAFNFFMTAPVIIGLLRGDDYVIELANEQLLEVWGRTPDVIGKPLLHALPEFRDQGFIPLLEEVRTTRNPFYAYEFPITVNRHGKEQVLYFDFIYKAYYENETSGKADGIISIGHDVTSQVYAKKIVQESESKYRTLFESMDQGFCIFEVIFNENNEGVDYRFLEVNPAFERQSGLKDALGKRILELAPAFEDRWPKHYGKVVLTGEPLRIIDESKALGKWFDIYAFRLGEEGSKKVAAFFTDISEQKKAVENLRESDERFRNLADESPLFVFIIESSPEAPVTYWNKCWLEYTGQTMEEALGTAWNGKIHSDDLPFVQELYTPAYEKKQPYIIPGVRVKKHDGEYRWHTFKGNPRFLADGSFDGYVGVGFDIHDQKLAENTLKENEVILQKMVAERTTELENQKNLFDNILRNSSNGITVTEMIRDEQRNIIDARTIMANDAAVKYIGLPKDVFLSTTALQLDPGILESEYGKTCLKTLATGEPALSQYFIEMTSRWQELTISKMDDDHLIHIFTDVTPIKEAQLQLERTIEELQRSNTNLEEFAYAASHDLKEPIRKIHIFSDKLKSLLSDRMNKEEKNFFERMDLATNRMNTLIDDLLQYSYVSKGAVADQPVNLNQVIQVVLEDLDMEIEDKNADLYSDPLPTIIGHKRQLQQLFQNLIGNALKYTLPDTLPVIKITSRIADEQDKELHKLYRNGSGVFHLIEVKDNGIGFNQTDADKIFKVFTRLHGNAEYKGSGVGLSIVRKVVENHNGYIWAEGTPGQGATFKIILPEK
jgi:PAS domain S-box-containing protein